MSCCYLFKVVIHKNGKQFNKNYNTFEKHSIFALVFYSYLDKYLTILFIADPSSDVAEVTSLLISLIMLNTKFIPFVIVY